MYLTDSVNKTLLSLLLLISLSVGYRPREQAKNINVLL